jgi:hypothetical protein
MVLGMFGRHRSEIVAYLPERDGKILILFPVAEGAGRRRFRSSDADGEVKHV